MLEHLDVGAIFHSILFAYQKAIKDILGSGSAIFVQPILETLKRINENKGINLTKGRNIDETLNNLAKIFLNSGLVREFKFERVGPEKYVLHVDGCIWAKHIHGLLKPKDVTCPYAIIAMAVFEEATGKTVRFAESEYSPEGTKTTIEPL